MLKWALIFFLISIVAGLFGFTGLARGSATIAKVLFFLFLVIFIIVLILAITAGEIHPLMFGAGRREPRRYSTTTGVVASTVPESALR